MTQLTFILLLVTFYLWAVNYDSITCNQAGKGKIDKNSQVPWAVRQGDSHIHTLLENLTPSPYLVDFRCMGLLGDDTHCPLQSLLLLMDEKDLQEDSVPQLYPLALADPVSRARVFLT